MTNVAMHQILPLTETLMQEYHELAHQRPVWVGGAERWTSGGELHGKTATVEYTLVRSQMFRRVLVHNACLMVVTLDGIEPNLQLHAPLVCWETVDEGWLGSLSFFAMHDLNNIIHVAGRPPWHNLIEVYPVRRYASPSPQVIGWDIGFAGRPAKVGK